MGDVVEQRGDERPAGDDEPALAGLGVDDEPLEPVGQDQDLVGLPRAPLRGAQVGDRGEQHGESGADDQREHGARCDHPAGQPAPCCR